MTLTATNTPKPKARPRGRPFAPGQSGNPRGKPPGTRNHATQALEDLIAGRLLPLGGKVLDKAEEGEPWAARLIIGRFLPRAKAPPPAVELPPILGPNDVDAASAAVLAAAAEGEISPREALVLHQLVEARGRAVGWAPPAPVAEDATDLLLQSWFDYTPPGADRPEIVGVPVQIIRQLPDGTRAVFNRVDAPGETELALEHERSRREHVRSDPVAPPRSAGQDAAPPAAQKPAPLPPPAPASSPAPATRAPRPIAEARPEPTVEQRQLAEWEARLADPDLPEHKREQARLEVLRRRREEERRTMIHPGPVFSLVDPSAVPPDPARPEFPPPPRDILIDAPLRMTDQQHRAFLRDEGLDLDAGDIIRCRYPVRDPSIVSVTPLRKHESSSEPGGRPPARGPMPA